MSEEIIKVSCDDKRKDGSNLVTKHGKPYFKVGIITEKYGAEKWINGLVFDLTMQEIKAWEGKSIEMDIKEEEYNGQKRLVFQLPRKNAGRQDLSQILTKLGKIEYKLDLLIDRKDGYMEHSAIVTDHEDGPLT